MRTARCSIYASSASRVTIGAPGKGQTSPSNSNPLRRSSAPARRYQAGSRASVFRDDGRRYLAPAEAIIDAEFHGLDPLLHVHKTGTVGDGIEQAHLPGAEIVVIELDLGRPIVPKRPFDTDSRGPAGARLGAGRIAAGTVGAGPIVEKHQVIDAVLVVRPRD